MGLERENFDHSGPLHLTTVDWTNASHRRSVAASLVQSVYILERDRQEKREGSEALAPPWWKFFNFQLYRQLIDDADSSIFGAIYQLICTASDNSPSAQQAPRYVIVFRGTITKGDAFSRDLELDIHIIRNGLHGTSRFNIAIQAVRHVVATFGNCGVWLAGHSLGSAMAMLAGKHMAKSGVFLEAFLFNPPFFSAPIESIKDKKVKQGIRIAGSVITAGLAFAMKHKNTKKRSADSFVSLSRWLPCLFVNRADHVCSEYIGYFDHRKKMEEIGIGGIERLATQHSIGGLLLNAMGKESDEPLHLIPSANLTVNHTPSQDFKDAHGIHQWWRPDLNLESKVHFYK
ncbi:GDSL esterase/lipase At4g10955 [Olea europaea var. sylvestris]|uniref:GDSL esterase lipase At4g10955-like n=1 Tax=Olea europaea subsp. europaea TaxID=158383 RepID=A0A8S0SYF1_OLEEU|nr:GDSL esterase/lipase At4g10955 [Olea europaea var. sylvestris]CAA2996842.1 GDSL esterase lipase At4g10955-like [Olea europaea subsp. europaea]